MAGETREEIVDLGHRDRAETGAGLTLRVGGEYAALHHHIFARGEANALLWMARSGSRWRDLPRQLGRHEAVKRRYYRWIEMGVLDEILGPR